jgi:hypothetical protein
MSLNDAEQRRKNLRDSYLRTLDEKVSTEEGPKRGPGRPRKERNPRGRPRKYADPKQAMKEAIRKYQQTYPLRTMLCTIKNRCKKNNVEFDLTEEFIYSISPEYCPILDLKLTTEKGKGLQPNALSIDRMDPIKGYTKDNVRILSHKANRMKQDATPEELMAFAKWIFETYKK